MPVYQLFKEQRIPSDIETVWAFISSPENLKLITPDHLGFEITSQSSPGKIYPGMMITYKVKPLLNIKLTWVTEITHIENNEFFVDEQRKGPYKIWHHEHRLTPVNGETLMTDLITYEPPFGFLGSILNRMIIRKKLKEIFNYREKILSELF